MDQLIKYLDTEQQAIYKSLATPRRIQDYLDGILYSPEDRNRCPLQVMQDRQAHCLDGALFAAEALRQIGHPPVVVDLFPEPGRDDDHVLAIYKQGGYFGAIAKSNFVGLRFRDAIYRSLRELVLSYFEAFFNVNGEKTLREYTLPLNLQVFDYLDWTMSDVGLGIIEDHLRHIHRFQLLTESMIANLTPVDDISFRAGMMVANPAGLYQPHQSNQE